MNLATLCTPERAWPARVRAAVLLDALVQHFGELQAAGQFDTGPVTIYGKGLNVTLARDGTARPIHMAGTLAGQAVDLTIDDAKVAGTCGSQSISGSSGSGQQALDMAGNRLDSVESGPTSLAQAAQQHPELQELLQAMQQKGYQSVSETHGSITMDDTTIATEQLAFRADGLPTVLDFQVGGSHGEITVTSMQTRTGPQSRYTGEFDGKTVNLVEQARSPGCHP